MRIRLCPPGALPPDEAALEPLSASAPALEAHARLLWREAAPRQIAQIPGIAGIDVGDRIVLDDGAARPMTVMAVEIVVDDALAVTRVEAVEDAA